MSELNYTQEYTSGDFSYMLTTEDVGVVEIEALPNAEVAVTVATAIADTAHLIDRDMKTDVFFDEGTKTWIIAFYENPLEVGGELYIALDMDTAKVQRIWFEE